MYMQVALFKPQVLERKKSGGGGKVGGGISSKMVLGRRSRLCRPSLNWTSSPLIDKHWTPLNVNFGKGSTRWLPSRSKSPTSWLRTATNVDEIFRRSRPPVSTSPLVCNIYCVYALSLQNDSDGCRIMLSCRIILSCVVLSLIEILLYSSVSW